MIYPDPQLFSTNLISKQAQGTTALHKEYIHFSRTSQTPPVFQLELFKPDQDLFTATVHINKISNGNISTTKSPNHRLVAEEEPPIEESNVCMV
jgi:hypothetical protein